MTSIQETTDSKDTVSRHGLANVGNTCYLNSAIQALRSTKVFSDYFGTDAWTKHRHEDRRGHELAGHVATLVAALKAPGTTCVNPLNFARAFVKVAHDFNEDIRPGVQADGAEAVQILLDALHSQQAREVNMDIKGVAATADQAELIKSLESWVTFFHKEYSPIIDAFFGQTQKKVKCDACGRCSTTYEPWGVFKVPIPGADKAGAPAPTLQECIAAALAPEKMDDYFCETCAKKGPATIELAISKYPKQMIISIKRFINSGAKVRCRVPYDPDAISLNECRAWPSIQGPQNYRVSSTIEHLGSSRGGHYVMRSREPEKPEKPEKPSDWYLYDDSRVSLCMAGGVATPDTYVLFLETSN